MRRQVLKWVSLFHDCFLDAIFPIIMLILYYQVYEPVGEGSYIKMIDKVSGHGGQIQVSLA